jgi:hypothetical protein
MTSKMYDILMKRCARSRTMTPTFTKLEVGTTDADEGYIITGFTYLLPCDDDLGEIRKCAIGTERTLERNNVFATMSTLIQTEYLLTFFRGVALRLLCVDARGWRRISREVMAAHTSTVAWQSGRIVVRLCGKATWIFGLRDPSVL